MKRLRSLVASALVGLAICSAPALADGAILKIITPADTARLEAYEATKAKALAESRQGPAEEVAELDRVLARPLLPLRDVDLTGAWQCRTIKVGGILPVVMYSWFRCEITDDGAGYLLTKLTGSQRTRGFFYDDGDARMIYLGYGYVNDEEPGRYGTGPERDQVAYAYRDGPDRLRLEFPAPARESVLDILELRR